MSKFLNHDDDHIDIIQNGQWHPIESNRSAPIIDCTTGKCSVYMGIGPILSQLIVGPVGEPRCFLWSNNETDTTRQTVWFDSLLHHVIHHWYRNVQSIIPKLVCYVRWNYGRKQIWLNVHQWTGTWLDHDDVIKWKHSPRYWPFVRGIHRSPVNSPHKGQWRGALVFSLICAWIKSLGKQSWGWWFETPSRSLWRHCNDQACTCLVCLLYII